MQTTTQLRDALHEIRFDDTYYEVKTVRTNGGFQSTWSCFKCRASRQLCAPRADDVQEQAFASIEGHHLFFHADHGSNGTQPDFHPTTKHNRD